MGKGEGEIEEGGKWWKWVGNVGDVGREGDDVVIEGREYVVKIVEMDRVGVFVV